MYRQETLEKYVDDAAMGTPTPGGGSVAALVGALAISNDHVRDVGKFDCCRGGV